MTLELDQPIDTIQIAPVADQTLVLSGKLVSFRYLGGALRRRRRFWLALGLVGLVIGGAFHVVVPRKYSATATLYLAHAPGTDDAVGISNDLALVNNSAVAQKAIATLDEPSLNPATFLGKTPAKSVSDNVIIITMEGPSYTEAVNRVNAVTSAYLSFRSEQYTAQNNSIVDELNKEIGVLQSQVTGLSGSINNADLSSDQLSQLVAERSQDQTEITNLQQTQQTDQLGMVAAIRGSRVLTPGTAVYHSTVKLYAVDALAGLGAGLVIGVALVSLQALLSDRVRRREDLASLVGAPVEVSTVPIRRSRLSRMRSVTNGGPAEFSAVVQHPDPELAPLIRYFGGLVSGDGPRSLLVVAVDDLNLPSVALSAVAASSAAAGKKVVLVDLTADRVFEPLTDPAGKPVQRVEIVPNVSITLFVPARDLGPEDDRAAWELSAERWQRSDVILALATVDIGRGAGHLRNWDKAVVSATTGYSTPQRISGTAELLRASGVAVASAVLLSADADDDSVGRGQTANPWTASPLGDVVSIPPSWK